MAERAQPIDLSPLARLLDEIFESMMGDAVPFALCFQSLLTGDVHWVTNVSRDDGVDLFRKTAAKMATNVISVCGGSSP